MAAVGRELIRPDEGVALLFTPPFDKTAQDPGYIKGYPPGVRENGGQYTHAALWSVMAFAALGQGDKAANLFWLLNPINHARTRTDMHRYKVEPYVVAADVYTNPQHAGRGGWTWYTGSAGWMYRFITESLLGIRIEVDRLRVSPLLPPSWPAFEVHYRYRETVYHLKIRNLGGGKGVVKRVVVDGADQADGTVPLCDDRRDHHADIEVD